MTTQAQATEAICSALMSTWANETAMDWPNVAREGTPLNEGNEPWAALHLMYGGQGQRSLGAAGERNFEGRGTLTVAIFVPVGKRGLADADSLAMRAVNAYRGRTVDGVTFYNVGAHTVGIDGAWWRTDVRADFEFSELA